MAKVLPFPTTQAQMAEYQKKYYFDPVQKKWFTEKPKVSVSSKPSLESIAAKLKELKSQVPKIRAGIKELTADKLTESKGKVPEVSYTDETKPKDALGAAEKILALGATGADIKDWLKEQTEKLKKEKEEIKKERESFLQKVIAEPEKTYEERMKELEEKYKIPEKLNLIQQQSIKVAGLKEQIDKLELQRQAEIDRIYARSGVGMDFINKSVREINRQYDSQIAYKSVELAAQAAVLQAYQGNLDVARDLISDSIKAWLFDYEENRRRWEFAFNYYSDFFESLEKDEKEIINAAYRETLRQEEQAREDAQYKLDLWTRAAEAGVYLDYSDLLKMSKEEAAELYAKKMAEAAEKAETIPEKPTTKVITNPITGESVFLQWNPATGTWEPAPVTGLPSSTWEETVKEAEEEAKKKEEGVLGKIKNWLKWLFGEGKKAEEEDKLLDEAVDAGIKEYFKTTTSPTLFPEE